MQRCSRCKKDLELEHFPINNQRKNGRGTTCKSCKREYEKNKRSGSPEETKNRDLKRSFGISLATYLEMYAAQEGKCAICGATPTNKALAVDHCHKTDRIRGLLCSNCNLALGLFGDNVDSLRRALEYLGEKE